MKTNPVIPLILAAAVIGCSLPASAAIPEPDNVLYGSIVISNTPITADRTDVVIEAQRMPGGPAIASYRMGSDSSLGNFYSLTLKLESVAPVTDTNTSQVGESVFIVVKDNSGIVGQTSYQLPERGHVQRVDFGAPLDDVDGNGLPDLWELAYLGAAGQDPNAAAANGQTILQNYIAGTDPDDANDLFRVEIDRNGAVKTVWFLARKAEGAGYSGLTRRYTLQQVTDPGSVWQNVPAVTDVGGDNQTVTHQTAGTEAVLLFRAMISLAATNASPDALPDAWEIAMFGSVGQDPEADPDQDGQSTAAEYVAGTDPGNSNDVLRVTISQLGSQLSVSFVARQADGPGYAGLTRLYSLETRPGPGSTEWFALPGLSNIVATNQTVAFQPDPTNSPALFRANVQLVSP